MAELLKPSSDFARAQDSFGVLMPQATLVPVDFGDLPPRLREDAGNESCNCSLAFKIMHPDDTNTFVIDLDGLDTTFIQEQHAKNNRFFGSGTVYIQPGYTVEYFPYVGYTYTFEGYRKRGFGTRRLHIMNALALAKYGMPIYSSPAPRPGQRKVWEELVKQKVAEVGIFDGSRRYKFT